MNNLQIALDPSCIQIKSITGLDEMQISVVLTGLSFNALDDNEFDAAKNLLSNYYDNDGLKYDKIKVYFLNANGQIIGNPGVANTVDLEILKVTNTYPALKPFEEYINNEIDVTVGKIKERMVYNKFIELKEEIHVREEDFVGNEYVNAGEGYSNMAFANFSQLLPPLNEQAGLVLFSKAEIISIPSGAVSFLAFPYLITEQPGEPNKILNSGSLWKSKYKDVGVVNPDGTGTSFGAHYICIETEIPTGKVTKGKIELRDDKGNFDGRVEIEVSQELDWAGDYYKKIASYFDFAMLLQQFYSQSGKIDLLIRPFETMGVSVSTDTTLEKLKNIDGLLWRLVLDPFIIHTKRLSHGKSYRDTEIIDDTFPKTFPEWYENVLKANSNIKELAYTLQKLILFDDTAKTTKELYKDFWQVGINSVRFDLPDKVRSILNYKGDQRVEDELQLQCKVLIQDWMMKWSTIIESSRQFQLARKEEESDESYETRKFDAVGFKMIGIIVDHLKPYNTILRETANAEDYQKLRKNYSLLLIDFIDRYNESVYFYFMEGSTTNTVDDLVKEVNQNLPDYWNRTLTKLPTVFDFFYDIDKLDLLDFQEFLKEPIKDIDKEIKRKGELIFDPPPIQIKVHSEKNIINNNDDISDEIAGFVLLNQRSININDETIYDKWHYLNITKAKINEESLGSEFLKPLFLPEIDGMPLLSLSLTNQKRSLVAPELNIQNSRKPQVLPTQSAYDMRLESPEFWYGFHYQFAGFVILNSGALPPIIRGGGVNLYKDKKNVDLSVTNAIIAPYHHLRKVAISSPNVTPAINKTNQFVHKAPPSDFNPLAKELSFWKEKEYTYFLLSESEKFNKQINFDISRANTSLWDWFAFEKKTLNELLNYSGTNELYSSIKKFLEKKKEDASKSDLKLPDPAVADVILAEWQEEFPGNKKGSFTIATGKKFIIEWDNNKTSYNATNNTVSLMKGQIINIRFSSLIAKALFNGTTQKIDTSLIPEDVNGNELAFGDYYKFAPVSYCFEAAKHPEGDLEQELWELIEVNDDKIEKTHLEDDTSIKVFSKKKPFSLAASADTDKEISVEFAYISELEIKHQRWYWDGRLNVSAQEKYLNITDSLDPEKIKNYQTTNAMKWEAWSFSNRADHTGPVQPSLLKTFKLDNDTLKSKKFSGIERQLLLTIDAKGENIALYNRFAVTAYSRYRFLDKHLPKHRPIIGKIPIGGIIPIDDKSVKNQWKRFIQLSNRQEQLPTPVVRFFIPLTESINTNHQKREVYQNAASIMVVVEGNVYNEAGLAYGLEMGIEKVDYEENNTVVTHLNFATSPTISENGSLPLTASTTDPEYLTFEPEGPLGFTFDIAAENPKVTSSAYIMDLTNKDLFNAVTTLKDQYQAWSLMRVALRSVIRKQFHKQLNPSKLTSKWSEKTWVEYVLAIDTNIPQDWIQQVNQKGFVEINIKNFDLLPNSPDENTIERYIIVTKLVSDMGGMPVESYFGTFYYEEKNFSKLILVHGENIYHKVEGFMRILIVHKNDHSSFEPLKLWTALFESGTLDEKIENDSSINRPLITKRIATIFAIE